MAATGSSATFCSRSFDPIRCDFVAAFSGRAVVAAGRVARLRYDRHGDQDISDSQASPPAFVALDQEDGVSLGVVSSDMPPRLKVEA